MSDVTFVERLHAAASELAAQIAASHGARIHCRAGCAGCCSDGLTVFEIEAELITRRHPEVLASAPHEAGACAFLDAASGRCRVYDARPYVCRTQGLPLRWLDEDEEGEPYEARDVCTLNLEGVALEELPADALFTIGPFEERLAAAQAARDGGERRRVALRSLFSSAAGPAGKRRLPVAP